MKKGNEGLQKPFFAAFLENQLSEEKEDNLKGGATQKYPSDTDEIGGVTKPSLDLAHTQKYPSDGDDDIYTVAS